MKLRLKKFANVKNHFKYVSLDTFLKVPSKVRSHLLDGEKGEELEDT